jgi:hypothetical protein
VQRSWTPLIYLFLSLRGVWYVFSDKKVNTMYRLLLACFAGLLLAPLSSQAQGLKNLEKVIVGSAVNAQKKLITESDIESQIVVALKRDIPKLKLANGGAGVFAEVTILPLDSRAGNRSGYCATISVFVSRQVLFLDDYSSPLGSGQSTVWSDSQMVVGPEEAIGSQIRSAIDQELRRLLAEL